MATSGPSNTRPGSCFWEGPSDLAPGLPGHGSGGAGPVRAGDPGSSGEDGADPRRGSTVPRVREGECGVMDMTNYVESPVPGFRDEVGQTVIEGDWVVLAVN